MILTLSFADGHRPLSRVPQDLGSALRLVSSNAVTAGYDQQLSLTHWPQHLHHEQGGLCHKSPLLALPLWLLSCCLR